MKRSDKISAIIRTKNSGDTLEQCLKLLQEQERQVDEIIVVDSGSSDNTLTIAHSYDCQIVHYPTDKDFNYSLALNIGIEAATNDYLLLLSSHAFLTDSHTTAWMIHFLTDHPTSCGISINKRTTAFEPIKIFEKIKWTIVNKYNFEGYALSNVCAIIKKECWRIYPFNEHISRCEDVDWSMYFARQLNRYIVRLENIYVLYKNPYYTIKKDIFDHILISEQFYRKGISKSYVWDRYKSAVGLLLNRKFQSAKFDFMMGSYILKYRISPYEIVSGHLAKKKRINV